MAGYSNKQQQLLSREFNQSGREPLSIPHKSRIQDNKRGTGPQMDAEEQAFQARARRLEHASSDTRRAEMKGMFAGDPRGGLDSEGAWGTEMNPFDDASHFLNGDPDIAELHQREEKLFNREAITFMKHNSTQSQEMMRQMSMQTQAIGALMGQMNWLQNQVQEQQQYIQAIQGSQNPFPLLPGPTYSQQGQQGQPQPHRYLQGPSR